MPLTMPSTSDSERLLSIYMPITDLVALYQAMMSVKRHLRGPGAIPIGRPSIHPSPIDLKGKAYE